MLDPLTTTPDNYMVIYKVYARVYPLVIQYNLYTGHKAQVYTECFGLIVKGSSHHLDLSSVKDVLRNTWVNKVGKM